MVKRKIAQKQKQSQIVNVHIGSKRPSGARKKRAKKGAAKREIQSIHAFNPPPIINFPPGFGLNQQSNAWTTPPAMYSVYPEGETAAALGLRNTELVRLMLQSSERPSADRLRPPVKERLEVPAVPRFFSEKEEPALSEGSGEGGFMPASASVFSPESKEEYKGEEKREEKRPHKQLGRPAGSKNKPKAVGTVFFPAEGTPVGGLAFSPSLRELGSAATLIPPFKKSGTPPVAFLGTPDVAERKGGLERSRARSNSE